MPGFKTIFLEQFEEAILRGEIKSICDFGSGESLNFISLLEKYPKLVYVGIEPSSEHAELARKHLAHIEGAKVYNASAYECPRGEEARWGSFDLVISLSVLEHVKQLDKFLENSVKAVRAGGQVVHRYDLGHALYPSSLKERLQVFLGDFVSGVLPEAKFVSGVRPSRVEKKLSDLGVKLERKTYHQMPGHKSFLKSLEKGGLRNDKLARDIIEWEFASSPLVDELPEEERIRLFPAVALWGRKS